MILEAIFFASLWSSWWPKGPSDVEPLATYTIVVHGAATVLEVIHTCRPVVLLDDLYEPWLDRGTDRSAAGKSWYGNKRHCPSAMAGRPLRKYQKLVSEIKSRRSALHSKYSWTTLAVSAELPCEVGWVDKSAARRDVSNREPFEPPIAKQTLGLLQAHL